MTESDRRAFEADSENYNCFSITRASLKMKELLKLKSQQIGKALYFLLWSNLLVGTAINSDFSFNSLPKLDMISDEEKTEIINGITVFKIPYYKLAVYLDTKRNPVP